MSGVARARPAARSGRRPGRSGARERILDAARGTFAEQGYDGATIRDIAARAAVDPALVHHYFGPKQRLFVAAMELPFDPAVIVPRVLSGPRERLGERFVLSLLDLWETTRMLPAMLGLLRSATSDEVAAAMLGDVLARGPVLALATAIDRPDAELRATLVGSQIVGLAMARFVIRIEPIASATHEVLAAAIGPTVQRYLAEDLGLPSDVESG